jgi:hypothetical protein
MMIYTRWILVVFASLLGWVTAATIVVALNQLAKFLFCPSNDHRWGVCLAPWWGDVEAATVVIGAALAAFLVIVFATYTAPKARKKVPIFTFLVGAVIAIFIGIVLKEFFALASALGAGVATTAWQVQREENA